MATINTYHRWTIRQVRELTALQPTHRPAQIANLLGLPAETVRNKINKLGLKKRRPG